MARQFKHECFTVDNTKAFRPSLCADILDLDASELPGPFDIIWASPPCTAFSIMTMGRNWRKDGRAYFPKTTGAVQGIAMLKKAVEIFHELKPKYFILENPRGMMRKMRVLDEFQRSTITYCRYGFIYMKPTDIWTNFEFRGKRCNNNDPCHIPSPRGSNTGIQGLANAKERGRIPPRLCFELLKEIERLERGQMQLIQCVEKEVFR